MSYLPTKIEIELPVCPGEMAWFIHDNEIKEREVKSVEVALGIKQTGGERSLTQETYVRFYAIDACVCINARKCFHSKKALLASL